MPRSLRITRPLTLFAELNDTALYGSLIFALQRTFDYAPLSTAISLSPMYLVSSPSAILLHKTILS
ncbi:hypothetical protein M5D10_13795 [Leptospira santarosai]|uniref:hypothetical protein n=1 Tax=Leptospira santarosai TaxID=28183 RepID=UPI0022A91651|nr:hypothetical protein [Leptospira santarosai]UZN06867.1 hypothetical protein M5D10_13795 [Leptospira santarosai]